MSENLERQLLALGTAWRGAVPRSLRIRISTIAQGADSAPTPEVSPSRGWRPPVIAAAALVGFIVLLVAVPGARVSLAHQAFRVLQALRVAPHTQLQTDDVQTSDEVNASVRQTQRQLAAGRSWQVRTAHYGTFGGSVRAGTSADVRRIDRPDLLSSLASLPPIGPGGAYRGEPVVFHHALLAPDGVLLTFFGYGETELFLVQAPVRNGQQVAYSRSVSGAGGMIIGVIPSIETFTVNGQQLTWDPDTTGIMPNSSALRWEADGVSYSLYGRTLTRDEALALFSTVRPLR